MKKLFVLICTLAIGTAAFAAPAKTAKVVAAHMTGTVAKYDAAAKVLTIKHDGNKETTFQLNDKSEVMQGKSKADASSLAASSGQGVKVEYVMDGSTRLAGKVDVAAAHAAAHSTAPARKK